MSIPLPSPPPRTPDELELSALYVRELPFVWRSVRRLGVPPRDLPDVTHDVFVTVLRNLWKFDARRKLRPWLFGVLLRVVSDHFRLARHHRESLDVPPDVVDPAPPADERAALREQWRLVDRALGTIALGHRAVLVMHDFEGASGPEIARALGIHHKTVYSRLRAARRRFLTAAADERNAWGARLSSPDAAELLEEPREALLDRGLRSGRALLAARAGGDPGGR